jgi:site-specific DNA-methyltransferase (adenine-specific)
MLYKGNMPKLNRLAVGIPYKDKSNVGRYSDVDKRCAGNIWRLKYETITKSEQKLHKDRFPIELPIQCIRLCGYKPKIVCDPFVGSCTTILAAKILGLRGIGIDIKKKNIITGIKRLKEYKA